MIRKLTEREHILQRPAMYIGSVSSSDHMEYFLEDNKITYSNINYCDGLIKIINEIIDNSVDVAIKTNFVSSTNINVNIDGNSIIVEDNGTGIPIIKNSDGHYLPELAWGHARAGSNFDDDDNRTQMGMNGVGSFATNCFSTEFIGETDDGKNHYVIKFKDNASNFTEKINKSKKQGTKVTFTPDLARFNLTEINTVHQNVIHQRLITLSVLFPEITFKFNNKKVLNNSFKKYVSLFSEVGEIYETEKYKFAILPNESDDFRQFSYVNGLKIPDGGMHIDLISNNIVNGIRDKISKKYKNIKPGDIKNKLIIIAFLKDLPNPKFNSQSKEKITNSQKEMNDYFGEIPYDKIVNKILKTPEIIDPITEIYRIKEELKKRAEMKDLNKSTKKIKSDKYIPSIGDKKYLLIVEGDSAFGSLSATMGRKDCGYYILKGKPLNSYSADHKKFTANKELTELYKIIQNENYQYITIATDADLDGYHIRGLLTGFFTKYLPDFKHKVGILQTPIIGITKKDKLLKWYYDLNTEIKINNGEVSNYYKGLGSWDENDLKYVVETDGLEKMIDMLDFNNDKIIDEWLGDDSEPRKKYILDNDFSIASL